MPDICTRMGGLHHLLSGETVRTSRYVYPPRHLWGATGQPGGRQRRALSDRLSHWWRAGR